MNKEDLWNTLKSPPPGERTCRNCKFHTFDTMKCNHEIQGTSKVLINEKCRYVDEEPRLWVYDGT